MTAMNASYPVQLEVDPPASLNRLAVLFRPILAIPHLFILSVVGQAQGVITFLAWWAIVFTGRYPARMLAFAVGVQHWNTRFGAWAMLLTNQYPPFSLDPVDSYPVRLVLPDAVEGRQPATTFFRLLLVIPHAFLLGFVGIAASLIVGIAWIVALFIGRVPEGMHSFLVGFSRWSDRVNCYFTLLVDDYPPFSFR